MRESTRRSRARGLTAGLLLLCLAACAPDGPPLRIVFITFDTLRHDGFDPEWMPRTQAFASRGQRFERFYAASSTTQPSHASLFTGLHPWQHGVTRNGVALPGRHETVAERLQKAGFETAAVVASFPLERRFGFDQGFDRYEELLRHPLAIEDWEGQRVEGGRFYSLVEGVVAGALESLDRFDAPRQFLWVHFFDPHGPYGDTSGGPIIHEGIIRELARRGRLLDGPLDRAHARYRDDLRVLDRELAPLLERLEADADEIETHVVLTSDHGESFGEDGSFGHGYRVSPEQVHVPLALVSPRLRPGIRQDIAGSRDVARTLLAFAGADAAGFEGRDLGVDAAGAAYGMTGRFGQEPDLRADGRELPAPKPRFFAAETDGLLTGDADGIVRDDRPEREIPAGSAAELRGRFASFEAQRVANEAPVLTDATTREALRALGYAE